MAKHVILVDGNSLMHANHNANVLSVGGMQVQAVFGFLKSLRMLMQSTPGDKSLIVLWDGRAQWRLELFPDYKGNRKAMDAKQQASKDAFKLQVPYVEKALSLLGIPQMRSPLLEADDIAGQMAPLLASAGRQVTMISGDKDWLQMVAPGVSWFDPIRDRRVDDSNFFDFTGYSSSAAFVQGKALQGDNSDNIPGIAGLGEKGAALFLAKWRDVNAFFAAVDAGTHTLARRGKGSASLHPEQILASPEGRAIFERNVKLMDLKQSRKAEPGELIVNSGSLNVEGFTSLCEELAFASILREQAMFLRAFNINTTA